MAGEEVNEMKLQSGPHEASANVTAALESVSQARWKYPGLSTLTLFRTMMRAVQE